jgi:general secretion pathway protein E
MQETKITPPNQVLGHLRENSILTDEQLNRVQQICSQSEHTATAAILGLGILTEDVLLQNVAQALDIEFKPTVSSITPNFELARKLGISFCKSRSIVPVVDEKTSVVCFLVSDAEDAEIQNELNFHIGVTVETALTSRRNIKQLIDEVSAQENSLDQSAGYSDHDIEKLNDAGLDGPVIRFVNSVLDEAIDRRASDIHFESQEEGMRIRMRIDGRLSEARVDPNLNVANILARVKVLADLNVSERRLPQDGRISEIIQGRKIDFRVSTVPTSFGESVVVRVLDPHAVRLDWDALGFEKKLASRIKNIVEQPNGLFLVSGPTGSGKTTTLYCALSHLNQPEAKILTVEDPIEYNLYGIEQIQVHSEIGMSFARALRALLRQDPDIIMVGEIRDAETAEIACRAAMVGRMVLSTIHTNAPDEAFFRLRDLGVPEYIIKSVLRGVLGQTLVPSKTSGRHLESRLITDFGSTK